MSVVVLGIRGVVVRDRRRRGGFTGHGWGDEDGDREGFRLLTVGLHVEDHIPPHRIHGFRHLGLKQKNQKIKKSK